MTDWILQNSMVAGGLAIVVTLLCALNRRRPALCHLMWLLVFVTLIAPPLPIDSGPGTLLRQRMAHWLSPPAPAEPVELASLPGEPVTQAPSAPSEAVADTSFSTPAVKSAAPPAAPEPSLARALGDVQPSTWMLLVWLAGSVIVLVHQLLKVMRFQRTLRAAAPASPHLQRTVQAVAQRLGVRAPDVSVVAGVGSPSVWCLGRARLLWPAGDTAHSEHGEATIIAHELAHIARRDHWVSRCEAVAMVLLWWHPLAWVIRRQVHDASELSCDAWALWAYPTGRRAYAEALIDAQEKTATAPVALHGLCATGRDIKDFERRLKMIMSHKPTHRVSRLAATVALLATMLVLPGFADDTYASSGKQKPDTHNRVTGKVDAHLMGQQANTLFADGKYEQALPAYQEWLAVNPDNGLAHSRIAYVLIGMGELEKANWHLKQQIALGFAPEVGTYNKACVAALSGDTARAQKALHHAVQLGFTDTALMAKDSDLDAIRDTAGFADAVAMADKAVALRKSLEELDGSYDKAAKLAVQVELARILTGDGKLQHEVGLGLITAGELTQATVAFEHQAAAGYKPANAQYNIACARALMGDTEAAFAALEESARLGMRYDGILDDSDLDNLRSDARFERLSQTIRISDENYTAFKQALKAGDADKAVALLDAMCAEDATVTAQTEELSSWGQYELGTLALANGQPKRALKHFNTALDEGYAADQTVFQMARAYAQVGEQELALQHLDDALTLGFADPWAVGELVKGSALCDEETGAKMVAWAKKAAAKKSAKEGEYKLMQDEKQKAEAKQSDGWESASDVRPEAGAGKAVADGGER